jgi:hypothetical protein
VLRLWVRPVPALVKHLSGVPFYGRLLTLPTNIRLGWKGLPGIKCSSLLRKFISYGRKKFYTIVARSEAEIFEETNKRLKSCKDAVFFFFFFKEDQFFSPSTIRLNLILLLFQKIFFSSSFSLFPSTTFFPLPEQKGTA